MKKTNHKDDRVLYWLKRIEDRLSGDVVDPPIPLKSDDGLEDHLVSCYYALESEEKRCMEDAVLEILLSARKNPFPPPWLGHLFHLIRLCQMEAVSDVLVSLFLADQHRGNPLRKAKGAYQASQLHELMHAIRGLNQKNGPLAWGHYLNDSDLAQYAFYGLAEGDLNAATEALPEVWQLSKDNPTLSMRNSLAYFIGQWRSKDRSKEPVAAMLLRFGVGKSAAESQWLRNALRALPSARGYLESYEALEREFVLNKNTWNEEIVRSVFLGIQRHIDFELQETWEILDYLRNCIHSGAILNEHSAQQSLYDLVGKAFSRYSPNSWLKIAAT